MSSIRRGAKRLVADACGDDEALRRGGRGDAGGAGMTRAEFGETAAVRLGFAAEPASRRSASVTQLAPGAQLGPYQILSLWETGGMGEVYGLLILVSTARSRSRSPPERFSERFDREARAIATLNHPNICTVHDVGPNYLVTELVDGETLRDWFKRATSHRAEPRDCQAGAGGTSRGASCGHCPSRLEARKRHGPL